MHTADIGDLLYIIILAVLMLAGTLEKFLKTKRQQQNQPQGSSSESFPYEDEEQTADNEEFDGSQNPDEIMRRILKTFEEQKHAEEVIEYPIEAQSLETEYTNENYQPDYTASQPEEKTLYAIAETPEEEETSLIDEPEFDLQKAVVYQEILKRKYF